MDLTWPTPTIEITSVRYNELHTAVYVDVTVSGIEHDPERLTFQVLILSSEGSEHQADITIPQMRQIQRLYSLDEILGYYLSVKCQ